jgi:hypothetical protein
MHSLEVTRHVTRQVTSPGGNISNSSPGGNVNEAALPGHAKRFQRRTGRMIRRKKRA